MRDRRDYVIAALAAALLFCLGILVGQQGSVLPAASAQDTHNPTDSKGQPEDPTSKPGGITISQGPRIRPGGLEGRTSAPTASDSDSNQRFVAVTCPIDTGGSVLFLLDSKSEHLAVYRFQKRSGLEFLAGRKIDYDLKITAYQDASKFTRDEMKRLFEQERAKAAAKAVKSKKGG